MEYILSNFQGPLDLLLHMLSKNKIDIKDIFVSTIIEQFLAVVEQNVDHDLDQMSEFVYVASRLLYIKSKKMLPLEKEDATKLEEEFIQEIFEYSKIKYLLDDFRLRFDIGSMYFEKPRDFIQNTTYYNYHTTDIIKIVRRMFDQQPLEFPQDTFEEIIAKEITTQEAMDLIQQGIEQGKCYFSQLITQKSDIITTVALFLGVLTLCHENTIFAVQQGDDIFMNKRKS